MPKKNLELISVIIPAYKQESTILKDLENIKSNLDQIKYDYEMLVVVDGKIDKTYELAKKCESSKIKILAYEKNHGKGYAVRYGMARAKGDLVAFIDSGMDINPNGIRMMIEHLIWYQADVIVGSKRHPASKVIYPFRRKIYSMLYQMLIWVLFGLKVKDTQVGLKLFRRAVLEDVLPRLLVKRYAFDIELLAVARYLGYGKIYEGPVELDLSFPSSIRMTSVVNMLLDTLAVFYSLRILNYYSNKNKRRWVYDPDLDYRVNVG